MGTFLKQQLSITVYRLLPRKINFRFTFPFAANKRKFSVSVFRLQETNGSCLFPVLEFRKHGDMNTWRHGYEGMEMKTWRHGDMETRGQGDMETRGHGDMETWRHEL
jgi:hypothetical protein